MKKNDRKDTGSWVGYRPEIKVLDCTVRDGGLINNNYFKDDFVKAVYDANIAAGVDYMEIGYKTDETVMSRDEYGPWKFCSEEEMRRVIGDNPSDLKISVMADTGRTNYEKDILPCEDSVVDMVRVACYIHQIPAALEMIKDAKDKGYEVCLNLMAVSVVPEHELDDGLAAAVETPIDVLYLVDSFGSLYSEQVQFLLDKYITAAQAKGIEVGVHAHNNQTLAYANTIECIIKGVNYLDATYSGMGRGAGNCPIELLIGFLHNPKYKIRPVLKCIEQTVEPMRKEMQWGPSHQYMLTGMLNEHPRVAIAHMNSDEKDKIVKFYDDLIQETS